MLYACASLDDGRGNRAEMLGLMPGAAVMQQRLARLGMQRIDLEGGTLRGHTFHYSRLDTPLEPMTQSMTPDGREGEALYRVGSLTATYMHFYFASAPLAAEALFAGPAPTR